jgi:CheY-like chemotaxis protein
LKTILVVEDEANLRLLYGRELERDGYNIRCAGDGREAVEAVKQERPDLVVLDMRMPNMDGIEALGRILGVDNKIPIIIHTAYPYYKDNFMSWAADAYVVKSSDLSELKREMARLLAEPR